MFYNIFSLLREMRFIVEFPLVVLFEVPLSFVKRHVGPIYHSTYRVNEGEIEFPVVEIL